MAILASIQSVDDNLSKFATCYRDQTYGRLVEAVSTLTLDEAKKLTGSKLYHIYVSGKTCLLSRQIRK